MLAPKYQVLGVCVASSLLAWSKLRGMPKWRVPPNTKGEMKKRTAMVLISLSCWSGHPVLEEANAGDQIPISAPLTSDAAGTNAEKAMSSVMRIYANGGVGTGFLHKSGYVITAGHVVGCAASSNIFAITAFGNRCEFTNVIVDTNLDLALLQPAIPIQLQALELRTVEGIRIGSQVTTWGFPFGYTGSAALVISGIISGQEQQPAWPHWRWVINGALNSGNSGGPLINVEDGKVIGVVVSKMAPLPPRIEYELSALDMPHPGVSTLIEALPDGSKRETTEAKIITDVLKFLRSQTQLVIGHAVTTVDLGPFLIKQGIVP